MAAPSVLDFAALLAPIPGENPCGSPLPYETRQQLEEARKEENPDDYEPDDPDRPEVFRKADWQGIINLASDTLGKTSKDLLLTARLTEALARKRGFAGLRDGIRLLRELTEQWWEQVYPTIDDGDLEGRAGPFNWLDDPSRGALFPNTVRTLPLVEGKAGAFSWQDWRLSQEGKGPVTREVFDQAVAEATPEACVRTMEEIDQAAEELERLRQILDARMGSAAPSLTFLRQSVSDCQSFMRHVLKGKRPESNGEADNASEASASTPPTTVARAVTSRAEAYRQLAQAAGVLQELEPHSPIPYLVKRAVELGSLSFPELMARLIRDAAVLTELNRELGIKTADQGSPES
jgi:type VI secretion system protein ImpA